MKKVLSLFIILVLVMSLSTSLMACSKAESYKPDEIASQWMSHIEDDTPIRKIAIPGTHDSGTVGMMSAAMTQGASIGDQLKMGARYFDIRVNNKGKIFHGPITGEKFEPIVDDIKTFLKTNPTEFLILDFQHFKKGSEQLVYDTLKSKDILDIAVNKTDKDMSDIDFIDSLTLKDVRGKVLIFMGSDEANKYANIFRRNNDDCSIKNASLDSLYIGDMHKKGSDYFIENALPKYFEHNIKKSAGILVLQGQLTAPNIFKSLYDLESEHSANMSKYVRDIKNNAKYLDNVNVIMRDFFDSDKEKCTSVLSLNLYKGIVKDASLDEYKKFCNIK